jgi:hypothetical protein
MADVIAELLERAVDHLDARDDLAAQVIRRVRRKRRIGAVAGAAVVAVAAVTGALLLPSDSSTKSVISVVPVPTVKTTPTATILDSLNGIDVTWLPPGLVAGEDPSLTTQPGHSTLSQYYGPAATAPVSDGLPPSISLTVQRGYAVDLQALTPAPGSTAKSVSVRGHPGVLLTDGPHYPGGGDRYTLTWVEANDLTLSLSSESPITAAQVMQTAAGLVVHPQPPGPADVPAATAAVRAALERVYNGGQPAATALASITNGEQLTSVLAYLTAHTPDIVRTARVTVKSVTFLDASNAIASITVSYVSGSSRQTLAQQPTVVLDDGKWKVSQDSYCATVATLVPSCPAR